MHATTERQRLPRFVLLRKQSHQQSRAHHLHSASTCRASDVRRYGVAGVHAAAEVPLLFGTGTSGDAPAGFVAGACKRPALKCVHTARTGSQLAYVLASWGGGWQGGPGRVSPANESADRRPADSDRADVIRNPLLQLQNRNSIEYVRSRRTCCCTCRCTWRTSWTRSTTSPPT